MASLLFFKCVKHFPISEPLPCLFLPFWNSVQGSPYILSKILPSTFITLCAPNHALFSFTAVNNLIYYMFMYLWETAYLPLLECKLQFIVTLARLWLLPAEVSSQHTPKTLDRLCPTKVSGAHSKSQFPKTAWIC